MQREGALDEQLGFGSRNEDGGIHRQPQGPELAMAYHIGGGLAGCPALNEHPVASSSLVTRNMLGVRLELRARARERVREQHFGIESSAVMLGQPNAAGWSRLPQGLNAFPQERVHGEIAIHSP
jgi:hypothetical protein